MKIQIIAKLLLFVTLFFSCEQKNEKNKSAEKPDYLALGDSIAMAAQTTLVSQLTTAINDGGTTYAISFCSENAQDIKKTLSEKYNCTIQRISEQYRNINDKPINETDEIMLKTFLQKHSAGEMLSAKTVNTQSDVIFYKPIMIGMPTCLKCHGKPNIDIDETILKAIAEKYPNDLATGYSLGDFRGAWKITFKK